MKRTKGQFGYLKKQKTKVLWMTILFFALSLAVFFFGYIKTGNKASLFSVIAVLGMLPASKSAVNYIMYCKAKAGSAKFYEQTLPFVGRKTALYELYLTSYEKNFPINVIVIGNGNLVGFSEWDICDVASAKKHIETMLKQNGYPNESVKIFQDFEKFKNRLLQLDEKEIENTTEDISNKAAEIAALLKNLSL